MRQFIVIVIVLVLIVMAASLFVQHSQELETHASPEKVTGDGQVVKQVRTVNVFDHLSASGNVQLKVNITRGPQSVVVLADKNILPYVQTNVLHGVLNVALQESVSINSNDPIAIEINVPYLRSLDFTGAVQASVHGVDNQDFKVQLAGTTRVNLYGHSNILSVTGDGGSVLQAGKFHVNQLNIDLSGQSNAIAKVTNMLNAVADETSKLVVSGNIVHAQLVARGNSLIDGTKLNTQVAYVLAQDAAKVLLGHVGEMHEVARDGSLIKENAASDDNE